ncbi:MAG: hypothetical protein SCJ94_01380 [Bacillota bacterium]|nr:hypothetical protein [Bacillota bacterium]MDW7728645.1 hypothetical protein [Bacillota bacterium]
MKIKVGIMVILVLVMAFVATGFTSIDAEEFILDGYKPLTKQIWAVSVSADPGHTGSISMSGQAAYGLPGTEGDEDYMGNYFTIEQETYVSSGETKRHIDISSPYSHGYLYEDANITGMARITDSFSMENLPAGLKTAASWWDLF